MLFLFSQGLTYPRLALNLLCNQGMALNLGSSASASTSPVLRLQGFAARPAHVLLLIELRDSDMVSEHSAN